jgi:transcriptional regulator with GAF, ATPase, and Fis domain
VTRLGSTQARTVDVRVLVATHRNLEERVQQGLFRQDLYYRLAVVPIRITYPAVGK